MKAVWTLSLAAIIFGGGLLYSSWADQPPPENNLAAISGQITNIERVTHTRWGRRNLIPKTIYAGHNLSIRDESGAVITLRIPEWEGIPEPRIEALSDASIRGRYDPRRNVFYELVAGKNVLATYATSSRILDEDARWKLRLGGIIALIGLAMAAYAFSNRNKPDPGAAPPDSRETT